MSDNRIRISQFDPKAQLFDKFGFYLLLGKRGTGKTTWCRWLNRFVGTSVHGMVIVIVDNEMLKAYWSKYVPIAYIYTAAEFAVLDILQKVLNSVVYSMRKHGVPEQYQTQLGLTIILDDLGSHSNIMNCKQLKKLASTGRHILANVFMLSQYLFQNPPAVRSQFTKVFMLQTANENNIKMIHKEYLSMTNLHTFKEVLNLFTQDYGVLVINGESGGLTIEDTCSFAILDDEEDRNKIVRLGKPEQWVYSSENYVENNHYTDLTKESKHSKLNTRNCASMFQKSYQAPSLLGDSLSARKDKDIHNRDNAVTEIPGIKGQKLVIERVFLAEQDDSTDVLVDDK